MPPLCLSSGRSVRQGQHCRSYAVGVSASDFVAPLFYFSDDVQSFDSMEALLGFVEPWDVELTDRGFDARGCRVVLSGGAVVRRRFSVGGGETVLNEARSGDVAADELEGLLEQLIRSGPSHRFNVDSRTARELPLGELVAAVHPVIREC